jgi:hypothetical protein
MFLMAPHSNDNDESADADAVAVVVDYTKVNGSVLGVLPGGVEGTFSVLYILKCLARKSQ